MTDIKSDSMLPEASLATKGICNDERACSACYSRQGNCLNSMTDTRDNPPPLPEPDVEVTAGRTMQIHSVLKIRQIEAAAFARGVAAMQKEYDGIVMCLVEDTALRNEYLAEIDELRAKLRALEEQKPTAWAHEETINSERWLSALKDTWPRLMNISTHKSVSDGYTAPLYLAAGAKP